MKKKILITILLLFCTSTSYAEEGGYAGAFLRMGLGARPIGMGGAYTSVCDDAYTSYYNPAGLSLLENKYVTTSIMMLSLNRTFNYVGFSQAIKPSGGISIGLINAGVSGIDERNFAGERIGSIQYSENAFMFSFAQKINKYVFIGATGKVLYHKLYQLTAKGLGLDVGVLILPIEKVRVGLLIKDLNARYSWNSNNIYDRGSTTKDDFPKVVKVGASYNLEMFDLTFACDYEKIQYIDSRLHFGFEKKWSKRFTVRGGINKNNLCFGGGMSFTVFGKTGIIDYGFENVEFDESLGQIFSFNILL